MKLVDQFPDHTGLVEDAEEIAAKRLRTPPTRSFTQTLHPMLRTKRHSPILAVGVPCPHHLWTSILGLSTSIWPTNPQIA